MRAGVVPPPKLAGSLGVRRPDCTFGSVVEPARSEEGCYAMIAAKDARSESQSEVPGFDAEICGFRSEVRAAFALGRAKSRDKLRVKVRHQSGANVGESSLSRAEMPS